jgi:hypothetical protein
VLLKGLRLVLGVCPVGPRPRDAPEAATEDAEGVDRPTAEGAQEGSEPRSWLRRWFGFGE